MTLIAIAGAEPEAGATTVAVGLAHRLAYAGRQVRVERLGGDARADADAAVFGALEFAAASGRAVDAGALPRGEGDTLVELPAGADAAALAARLGARLVLVSTATPSPASAAGAVLALANRACRAGVLALPEDRLLAAPTVGGLIAASHARVLARSAEGDGAICEHVVVGPISEDANLPHFRRFPRKAVITRAEKVDIALAALLTDTRCLILTGGADPSPYVLDRVAATRGTTLLLTPEGTVKTVRDVEACFGRSPFSGVEKVERAGELMRAALDDAALARLLG